MIDVLVAGGGPAGFTVVVVEKRSGTIDKACGEGLMPHSLAHLNRLGVDPPGKPLQGISYHDGHRSVSAAFRSGVGRGVQRTALHGALLDAVAAAGVKVVQGVVQASVGEFSQDAMSVRCGGFRARYLAAADGLHSPIRTALGLAVPTNSRRRWGIRRHVQIAPWSDNVEVHRSD
jgi:2-polyprenyl-6-methoxyphenol hydroxylase-like FAD-dependent oxidoreductase